MRNIFRKIYINFPAVERHRNHWARRLSKQCARTFIAAKCTQVWKNETGKDRGRSMNARVSGCNDCRCRLSGKCVGQSAQMLRREAGLIATHYKSTGNLGLAGIQSTQAGVDGCREAMLPILIHNDERIPKPNCGTNRITICPKYGQNRNRPGIFSQSQCALKQSLTVQHEQLLGLTKAAASSCGKNNGSNRHRHQFTVKFLTRR